MRQALPADVPQLVALMRDFYAEAGFALNEAAAAGAFAALLADERAGAVWLLEAPGEPAAGYLALAWCFSLEYGGLKAVVDDFYVRPACRNAGLGAAALAALPALCRARGVRALSVEVGPDNAPAQRVYRRAGFAPASDRELLVWPLAAPTHER